MYAALYPHAVIEKIGNCGHYPMQEMPIYLATLLEEFIQPAKGETVNRLGVSTPIGAVTL